ncbi:MAG: nicotinamide-nucleotide amidohydrolase family protein, partial [Alphaproteobacteria bacterium]
MTDPQAIAIAAAARRLIAICQGAGLRLAVGESCTGGMITAAITAQQGSSAVFDGGIIAYANEAKEGLLGVPKDTMIEHGSVSAEVAAVMAGAVRKQLRADIALRIGPQADSQLYQQRMGSIETGLFAAPGYLQEAGIPDVPDKLLEHRLIGNNAIHRWSLQHRSRKQQKTLHPTFSSWSSDIAFNTQLVRDGLGIALLP